jgi:hypothetical protein
LGDRNSSLRVAYIDIVETTKDRKTATSYYSKLVKAGPSGKDEVSCWHNAPLMLALACLCWSSPNMKGYVVFSSVTSNDFLYLTTQLTGCHFY